MRAAKEAAPDLIVAANTKYQAVENADLMIHHSDPVSGKPYIETEGSPQKGMNYWGAWSNPRADEWYQYDHIGEYGQEMKDIQLERTFDHFKKGQGYFFASTWLQARPPLGPNFDPGGLGTKNDPGMRWWLEAIREAYGSYQA